MPDALEISQFLSRLHYMLHHSVPLVFKYTVSSPPINCGISYRTKLKATARDIGLVKGASLQRQADQQPSAVAQAAHSGASGFPHVSQDSTATSKTSSLTLNVANSCHTSPFPVAPGPVQLDNLFYGSMNQQPAWIDQNSSDAFAVMGAESFTGGILNDHSLGQSLVHWVNQWPLTEALKDGGSHNNTAALTNTSCAPLVSTRMSNPQMDSGYYHSVTSLMGSPQCFPEEDEPVVHEDGHITGQRSAEMNSALTARFAKVEQCFLDLSTSTTFPMIQLINLFMKSCGCTVNGTNYWSLYAHYFKEHVQMELTCIGQVAQAGSGTPSQGIRTQYYDKFKEAFPNSYQDILLMHEEAYIIAQTGIPKALSKNNTDSLKRPLYSVANKVQFWETRCHTSDDAIISHLKSHVYNSMSLSVINEVFKDSNDGSCDNLSTPSNDQFGDIKEGQDNVLKWVKQEIIRQVAQLGGLGSKTTWDKNFPWKVMGGALTDASLSIRGYPGHKCLLPGEAHSENLKNKGIGALTQKEVSALIEVLKAGTMHIARVDKAHRSAVIASERPVIICEAPSSDWPHPDGRRLFADGHTDYNGPTRVKPSTATTKVKKVDKVPKAPLPPSNEDDLDDDDLLVTNPPEFQKPTMQVKVAPPPPSRPFKVVQLPPSHLFKNEAIELTSAEDNIADEPDTEYEEESRRKNRKLKSATTSCASKRLAPSNEKTDTLKVGNKGAQMMQSKVPPLQTMKGTPQSPLTVGSLSDGLAALPEHSGNGAPMRLQDGPSNEPTKVKGSKYKMGRALHMVYSQLDRSEVDATAAKDAVCGALTDIPVPKVPQDAVPGPVGDQQEVPSTTSMDAMPPINPSQEDLQNAVHDLGEPLGEPPHDATQDLRNPPHEPCEAHHEVLPVRRDPHEAHTNLIVRSSSTLAMTLMRVTLHATHARLIMKPFLPDVMLPCMILVTLLEAILCTHMICVTLMGTCTPTILGAIVRLFISVKPFPSSTMTLSTPCDAFHPHNPHYPAGLPPQDNYGSNEVHADNEFNTHYSSSALELHSQYGHGEHNCAYPRCYSPAFEPGYARESGYSQCDNCDEHPPYGHHHDGEYPNSRTRYRTDRSHDAPPSDYVPRGFSCSRW
ncbi:uncharacterized protein EDB93DRAFT_1099174 [Suillus bovinus]|uniref:uncharacterized protein n=1 Tax=Suillus bovinus TaxID=48563 RepID=UPI001B877CF8|nr:uncharacterized protein EDB93DRAFT_1099174 [Suillus bovinus]KAG2159671.1 hypothetical protein EDB93DRAFT_1099174 [Suillus bovinus]